MNDSSTHSDDSKIKDQSEDSQIAEIPETTTSFGAAMIDKTLYIYGGNNGNAHSYYKGCQANTLWRLNLYHPEKWEKVNDNGPELQGLAMVSHGGKLYRIGGFTAMNEKGTDQDLHSQDNVDCFDPNTGKWTAMDSLPHPCSSLDACVHEGVIYVAGGWNMQGNEGTQWSESAWKLDLKADHPKWKSIAKPPFMKRALSLAAHNGKIYCIGGLTEGDGPTVRVDIYHPDKDSWTSGPELLGEGMEGFGTSAFAVDGHLFVSTMNGRLQRLSDDGKSWVEHSKIEGRMFHRMVTVGNDSLLFVGGTNMQGKKMKTVEIVKPTSSADAQK